MTALSIAARKRQRAWQSEAESAPQSRVEVSVNSKSDATPKPNRAATELYAALSPYAVSRIPTRLI